VSQDDAAKFGASQLRSTAQFSTLLMIFAVALIGGICLSFARGSFGLPFVIAGAAGLVWAYQVPHTAARRVGATPGAFGDRALFVSDDGLLITAKYNATLYLWSGISGTDQRGTMVRIMRGDRPFHLVPLRAFASSADLHEFTSLVAGRADFASSGSSPTQLT
jgi:hypothetical protein